MYKDYKEYRKFKKDPQKVLDLKVFKEKLENDDFPKVTLEEYSKEKYSLKDVEI